MYILHFIEPNSFHKWTNRKNWLYSLYVAHSITPVRIVTQLKNFLYTNIFLLALMLFMELYLEYLHKRGVESWKPNTGQHVYKIISLLLLFYMSADVFWQIAFSWCLMEVEVTCKDITIFMSYTLLSSWNCEMHDWQYIFNFYFLTSY